MEQTKKCPRCEIVKIVEEFHYKNRVEGTRGTYCKLCSKQMYLENREKILESNRQVIKRRPEYYKAKRKEKYEKNKEHVRAQGKLYREANKEKQKITARKYHQKRSAEDPIYRLRKNLRGMTSRYLHGKKNKRTYAIIGCSIEEFILYMESKFESWMSWNNYGSTTVVTSPEKTWDIDHIVPLSSAKTDKEVYKLNHYLNLQPMCSYKNRYVKRDKV